MAVRMGEITARHRLVKPRMTGRKERFRNFLRKELKRFIFGQFKSEVHQCLID
jgi:hypothetical protein